MQHLAEIEKISVALRTLVPSELLTLPSQLGLSIASLFLVEINVMTVLDV